MTHEGGDMGQSRLPRIFTPVVCDLFVHSPDCCCPDATHVRGMTTDMFSSLLVGARYHVQVLSTGLS